MWFSWNKTNVFYSYLPLFGALTTAFLPFPSRAIFFQLKYLFTKDWIGLLFLLILTVSRLWKCISNIHYCVGLEKVKDITHAKPRLSQLHYYAMLTIISQVQQCFRVQLHFYAHGWLIYVFWRSPRLYLSITYSFTLVLSRVNELNN